MTASTVRTLGASGATQRLVWDKGDDTIIKVYCWGAGGGGGGNDSAPGGDGSGGGYAYNEFSINNGDILDISVGSGGGPGASGTRGAGAGYAGSGYLGAEIFNSVSSLPSGWGKTEPQPSNSSFVNTYGIWPNSWGIDASYTWTITAPTDGWYTFQAGFNTRGINYLFWGDVNYEDVFLTPNCIVAVDGVDKFYVIAGQQTFEQNIYLTAGAHTVSFRSATVNTFWQQRSGSFGLRIGQELFSFSGARGGNAGGFGTSGGGGGGGGATTVHLNSVLQCCAGGGGGGGGGGNNGVKAPSAPGTRGQASAAITNGQNGTNKNGDGGGGGGGGGGTGGGSGGDSPGGDVGGQAGSNGGNFGLVTDSSNGVLPAGSTSQYYNQFVGRGGTNTIQGANGACVIEFYVGGINVKTGAGWQKPQKTFVKVNDVWRQVQAGYIKVANQWQSLVGSFAPGFLSQPNIYGVNSRDADGDAGAGGGGGGCKIICTKLHELGYLPDHIYQADEQFGEWLRLHDPYAYYGYVKWASVVVDWMEKDGPQCMFWIRDPVKRNEAQRNMAIAWARRIATPWAQHMAYVMGVESEDNRAGRLIMKTGRWVSRLIGRFSRTTQPSKSPALGYVMWLTFGVFWLLAGVK